MKQVVGVEDATYLKDGKPLVGVRLHITEDSLSPKLKGCKAFSVYISGKSADLFKLGTIITETYDILQNGKAICTGVIYFDDIKKGG